MVTPQLVSYAKQLAYIASLTIRMGLLRRIEFAVGTDLDLVWGRVYELRRLYGESDDVYRKRLQVYLKQLAGSGTKPAIEEIVSIINEWPNSCRVDTYGFGYCRIYVTNSLARIKARARLSTINSVLQDTVAAGIDYRFYIPYWDLRADIALQGPAPNYLSADVALSDEVTTGVDASIVMASIAVNELDADIVLGSIEQSTFPARLALQEDLPYNLPADIALSSRHDSSLLADEAIMGEETATFRAYECILAESQSDLTADIAMQGIHFRPVEARIKLVAA